ncbi:MAG: DUF4097 domain-containing protein [Coriobacteriales bacterium]|jgi:hypothetical protein|nr:DUF4097 domain-containing protein [Coriobacteriales bacterium]
MKKGTRNLLIVALGLILVGGILGITGYRLGGAKPVNLTPDGPLIANHATTLVDERWNRLTALDIDADALDLRLVEGDSFSLTGSYDTSFMNLVISEEKGVLVIRSTHRNGGWLNFGFGNSWPKQELTLTYPRDTEFDAVSVTSDLGSLRVEGLEADTLDVRLALGDFRGERVAVGQLELDMDLGNCELDELEVSGSARTKLDSGRLSLRDSRVNDLTATNNLGSLDFSGSLSGTAKIDVDLGSLEFRLDNDEADIAYTIKSDMGSITLNGRDLHSSATGGPSSAPLELDINANMGSVNIRTK